DKKYERNRRRHSLGEIAKLTPRRTGPSAAVRAPLRTSKSRDAIHEATYRFVRPLHTGCCHRNHVSGGTHALIAQPGGRPDGRGGAETDSRRAGRGIRPP